MVLLLGACAAWAAPVLAAGQHACLDRAEQAAAVAAHQVIPLAEAIKIIREHGQRGEVVRARLCRRNGALDYVVTMLSGSGKVISASINAANGEPVTGR
jgi:uncharacterized membrane protein YkoI